MAKHKRNAVGYKKFIPRISSVSRRIVARRFEQTASTSMSNGIPHFMREITGRVQLAPISSDETTLSTNVQKEVQVIETDESINKSKQLSKEVLKPITMSKQPSVLLDDNVFTFRPKVSSTSAKIVENMGTDFMGRQQQHLDKQKKHVSCMYIGTTDSRH